MMTSRYRFDPAQSRFQVHAFATGVLSVFAHSPTFAVRDFRGGLGFEGPDYRGLMLDLIVNADSLELEDRVSAADRQDIEGRMRKEVLETAAYPELRYEAAGSTPDQVAGNRYRIRVDGRLTAHGVTNRHGCLAEILALSDGLVFRGEFPLKMSDYRIRPITALAGTIRLKDELAVSFDLACFPEGP